MVRSTTPYIWYAHKVARCQYNSPTPDTARFLSVLQVVRHGDGPFEPTALSVKPTYQRVPLNSPYLDEGHALWYATSDRLFEMCCQSLEVRCE